MGTYIFPAADASCPLAWVVNQLETAGFEVASHENIGIQYSETISRWDYTRRVEVHSKRVAALEVHLKRVKYSRSVFQLV